MTRKSYIQTKKLRKILLSGLCIAGLIFAAAGCGSKETSPQDPVVSTSDSHSEISATTESSVQEPEQNTENDNANAATSGKNLLDARVDFAAQPGKPVGTTEQSEEKVVYLTLDDGPSENTQKVLDILDQYNCKATFFVTGEMPEYKDMIKVAYDKGHTIGLHTYSHTYSKVYASVDAYFEDLDQIGQMVKDEIGYVPCFIRFPGGSSNTVSAKYTSGIMSELVKEVQERGYQYYDWNASSGDGATKTTQELIQQATSYHSNNLILLCHDAQAKDTTVEALPSIIEYYQSQGYVFKALDRDSFVAHHSVNN